MPRGPVLPWEEKVAALERFQRAHSGSTLVPQSYEDPQTGFRLGRWVANLRQRADFLSAEQLESLDHLHFVWTHRPRVMPWAEKMDILKRYKQEHGNCLVPKDYVDDMTGFRLGGMVDRLRQSKSTLNKARLGELEAIGFCWNKYEAHWQDMFGLLCEFKEVERHVQPTAKTVYQGKPLGQWVSIQKQLYARRQRMQQQQATGSVTNNGGMSQDRIDQLESIGFKWSWQNVSSNDSSGSGADDPKDGGGGTAKRRKSATSQGSCESYDDNRHDSGAGATVHTKKAAKTGSSPPGDIAFTQYSTLSHVPAPDINLSNNDSDQWSCLPEARSVAPIAEAVQKWSHLYEAAAPAHGGTKTHLQTAVRALAPFSNHHYHHHHHHHHKRALEQDETASYGLAMDALHVYHSIRQPADEAATYGGNHHQQQQQQQQYYPQHFFPPQPFPVPSSDPQQHKSSKPQAGGAPSIGSFNERYMS